MATVFLSRCTCRLFYSKLRLKTNLIQPALDYSTFSHCRRAVPPIAWIPLRNQQSFYYVKPKQKKGPSLKGWVAFGAACFGLATAAVTYLGLPNYEADAPEDLYKNEPVPMQFIYRARDTIWNFYEMFTEPSSKMLLPKPLEEPYYQPPYTLVLEMTDVLVHPEYDRKSGWRFRKRPGVDAFLNQLGPPLFEIVIYTHEVGFSASPVLDGLDPNGMIMYRLFRDATKYKDGTHVKDLSCLNRDLAKVLVIDCNKNATGADCRNALILKKWEGDPTDKTLVELIPFLQTVATSNVEDVRTVLDFYRQEDDIVEAFKRNQARLREEEAKRAELQQQQGAQGQWSGMFSRGLFGRSAAKSMRSEK